MSDPKDVVEQVRRSIEESRGSRLWQDSIHMLDIVSESIFSRSAHFILELLQNAEDACRIGGIDDGWIEFHVSPERVKVTHNGKPFDERDVNALCGVRSTKKPEQGTLGYLGIGFKSVFKVTDRPEVHSGGYHFNFERSANAKPAEEPWQIMPHWVGQSSEAPDESLTVFTLRFRSPEVYQHTLSEIRKLDVHVFLFLKRLKRLRVVEEDAGKTLIENLGEQERIVTLSKNGTLHRFVVFRREASVPPEVASDPALEFYKRQNVPKREVVIAFGVNEQGNLSPIEDASALGSVSSFLPLVEERSGAKFLIQSDFLVQPGREALQYELKWNQWLVEEAAECAKHAVGEFKKHPVWRTQFLPVFRFQEGTAYKTLFRPKLHEPLLAYLKGMESYPTHSSHARPDQTVQPEECLIGLVTDEDLKHLFPNETNLRLAHPSVDPKTVPGEVQRLVKGLTIGQVARNRALLGERASRPDGVKWFLQFYSAMAQTGQYYTRTPILVLTDKNSVVPADKVCFRQIPDEVLSLRQRFKDVDSLLAPYQFIHQILEADSELAKFFRERTDVQSIDYGKICGEVFLPKVRVDVQAPPRDVLIAYTRLLQKGPQIQWAIWVVTAKGNVKPSNQVFLASEYSPSEDWQRNSDYSPEMDFLSGEYLVGVSREEIPRWKGFFVALGVKERGDESRVEMFAKAFVQDKLAPELSNWVPKDRQKQGYDLEATRQSDNRLVKIEVKGRKQAMAIDLDGLEPKTAQQATANNEPFWLCVVPGIPENPELWVVENVVASGEFNVLTIPVSKWKANGRRVP